MKEWAAMGISQMMVVFGKSHTEQAMVTFTCHQLKQENNTLHLLGREGEEVAVITLAEGTTHRIIAQETRL
jgi:hypothetical protein